MSTPLLVVVGAMAGAPLRYLVDRAIQSRHDSAFPWGTFVVNAAGSFLLGAVAGTVLAPLALVVGVGTGFCGAFTTYSTFGYETMRLVEDGAYLLAAFNVVGGVVVGLGAAFGGGALAQVLW